MSVHQTKDGRWFVNYYQTGERKTAKRKYFGRGRESELAARQRDLDRTPLIYVVIRLIHSLF